MKPFMDNDFCLKTATARHLYHTYAERMPILDYHCHLSEQEICEDREPRNLSELWLQYDHYKWRQMRANGIAETFITGTAPDKEKFLAFAQTMPYMIGNPLYHWSHLELQRYFHITTPLTPETAEEIWVQTQEMIGRGGYSPRALIQKSNVYAIVTTEGPADDLTYHARLSADAGFAPKIVPAFRPDSVLAIAKPAWRGEIQRLSMRSGIQIDSIDMLYAALKNRMNAFSDAGCVLSDHAFERMPGLPVGREEFEQIFQSALNGGHIDSMAEERFQTTLLTWLAEQYDMRGWGMELHLGALRSANSAAVKRVGPDSGFDSVSDHPVAAPLRAFMDKLASKDVLPKMILFSLNDRDDLALVNLAGSFQDDTIPSKIQLGPAWWMQDHRDGMEKHMKLLANEGLLGRFIGMLTDSRSFLSYTRHEYFRRIFCNLIGQWVEDGDYPNDGYALKPLVEGVCFENAKRYLKL